jgi:hypothetical protein
MTVGRPVDAAEAKAESGEERDTEVPARRGHAAVSFSMTSSETSKLE